MSNHKNWTIEQLQEAVHNAITTLGLLEYGTWMREHTGQERTDSAKDWLIIRGIYDLSDEQAMEQLQLHIYQAYAVAHGGKSWDAMRKYKAFHAAKENQ